MSKKNNYTNKEKLYIVSGILFLLIILTVGSILFYNSFFKDEQMKGTLNLRLTEKTIISGKETQLLISVKNTGNIILEGMLKTKTDSAVNITYPEPELLNIKLHPGESITRLMFVTANSSSLRTDYEIIIMLNKDKTVLQEKTILTVKNS